MYGPACIRAGREEFAGRDHAALLPVRNQLDVLRLRQVRSCARGCPGECRKCIRSAPEQVAELRHRVQSSNRLPSFPSFSQTL